jgi:hypothetical protein
MAMSKGMAHAHGHSHGPMGHGGHHSLHEGGVHVKQSHKGGDHMENKPGARAKHEDPHSHFPMDAGGM